MEWTKGRKDADFHCFESVLLEYSACEIPVTASLIISLSQLPLSQSFSSHIICLRLISYHLLSSLPYHLISSYPIASLSSRLIVASLRYSFTGPKRAVDEAKKRDPTVHRTYNTNSELGARGDIGTVEGNDGIKEDVDTVSEARESDRLLTT